MIVLTAGHSATDPGAIAYGYTEAGLMLDLRDRTAAILRERGLDVLTDGDVGENLPLRHAIALVQHGEVALELHANASTNPAARGVEAISLPPMRAFARSVAQTVAQVLSSPLRGRGGWIDQTQSARGRLGYVEAGGVILETFFITNYNELVMYLERRDDVAHALADVLANELANGSAA